ncbi:hypothetical protein ALMP_72800 [Streptomyces sp. A012304]|nr:hypothetical protein ALMP_72800 [Streptomyces sp. A012304]
MGRRNHLAGPVPSRGSEHPLGRAIIAYADRNVSGKDPLPELSDFTTTAGRGVRGRVDGRLVEVVAPDDELPAALADALPAAEAAAHTSVLVRVHGVPEALIEVGDVVGPGSYRAVDRLRHLGIEPVFATGDGRHRPAPSPPGCASRRSAPAAHPRTKPTSYGGCGRRATGSRSSATASTTRRPSPAPTSASPWETAPTRPSEPPT